MMQRTKLLLAACLASLLSLGQAAEYDLPALERLALSESRAALAARDQLQAARHAAQAARAFPNPELEYLSGNQRSRSGLGTTAPVR